MVKDKEGENEDEQEKADGGDKADDSKSCVFEMHGKEFTYSKRSLYLFPSESKFR